jgi:plastocyanin
MHTGALTGVLFLLLTACGATSDDTVMAAPGAATAPRIDPAARAVTGTIHTVRMVMDHEGFRFAPSHLTVSAGDGVRFLMISGVPHNVSFDTAFVPRAARPQLRANLSLLGARDYTVPVVTTIDSAFVVSTSGLAPGDYLFYCAPHRSLNMHGVLTVR